MKLFLASFLQRENFGPGEIISICEGSKPKDLEVKKRFKHFIPSQDLINTYYDVATEEPERASKIFVAGYKKQLDEVVEEILQEASKEGLKPSDILPFRDGDTLCSWGRAQYNNYRKILAPYLEKLGYEVVLH